MQPEKTKQLTFEVPIEQDRLLEQLIKKSSIATDKGELLRLIIADHTDTKDPVVRWSHVSLREAERARDAIENQRQLINKTTDELAEDGEVSAEAIMDRLDEIHNKQRTIIEYLQYIEEDIY